MSIHVFGSRAMVGDQHRAEVEIQFYSNEAVKVVARKRSKRRSLGSDMQVMFMSRKDFDEIVEGYIRTNPARFINLKRTGR